MTWYEDLFAAEDPVRYGSYAESEKSRAQVDFVIEKLGLVPGARVLDLCCGQGRHLIDLARRGYDVVGVDLSEYMLGECRKVASEAGITACLVQSDMREIDFDSEFDAVINMWTSFGYLESDEENQKVLQAVERALKPGGRFMTELHNRDCLMRGFQKLDWHENSRGDLLLAERSFDCATGRLNAREVSISPDGRRTETSHSIRIYAYTEIRTMLDAAGLVVEAVHGGYDGTPFSLDTKAMMPVARKVMVAGC